MKKASLKVRAIGFVLTLVTIFTMLPAMNASAASYNGGWAYAYVALDVYNASTGGSRIGSIYAREGFTVLSQSGTTYFVEYSTSSGAKQGYLRNPSIVTSYLSETCVGVVNSSTTTYFGPNTSKYASAGSVYAGEIVAVLEWKNGWAHIEYNVSAGRKRGYVPLSTLTLHSAPSAHGFQLDAITSGYSVKITGTAPVYSGPSTAYPAIGSVGKPSGEIVPYCAVVGFNGQWFWYVEYTIDGTTQKKTGYVLQ